MTPGNVTEAEIRDWCIAYVKRTMDDPSIAIGPDATFAQMGLDSATSAYFIVELEEWLGCELDPEIVFDKTFGGSGTTTGRAPKRLPTRSSKRPEPRKRSMAICPTGITTSG